jgi:lysosomal acid lipase/cholesteryl ester hydrolase
MNIVICIISLVCFESLKGLDLIQNANDDWLKFVKSNNYRGEAHEVETQDGYILKVHRIVPRNHTKKIPVYLQHGLFITSGDQIITKQNSLGFLLSDNGYDVWFGNSRGNKFSLKHRSLQWNDQQFWNFSFHEMGMYDAPAIIDYILKMTNNKKLFYVGHSQGGAIGLVTLSTYPNYNDKVLQAHLLSPVSFMGNSQLINNYFKALVPLFIDLNRKYQMNDLLVTNKFIQDILAYFVEKASLCPQSQFDYLCKESYYLMMGRNVHGEEADWEIFQKIYKFLSPTVSVKQFVHFSQLYRNNSFRQFDYGKSINRKIYKSLSPPDYDLKSIKTPIYLYAAEQDGIISVVDIEHLNAELKSVVKFKKIPNYNHGDIIFGKNAKNDVFNFIIKEFSKAAKAN